MINTKSFKSLIVILLLSLVILNSCKNEETKPESPFGEFRIDNPVLNIPCIIQNKVQYTDAEIKWYINEILVSNEAKFYYTFTNEGEYTIKCKAIYKGSEFTEKFSATVYEPGIIIGDYENLHDYQVNDALIDNNNNIYLGYLDILPGQSNKYGIAQLNSANNLLPLVVFPDLDIAGSGKITKMFVEGNNLYSLVSSIPSRLVTYNTPIENTPQNIFNLSASYEFVVSKNEELIYFKEGNSSSINIHKYDLNNNYVSSYDINLNDRTLSNIKVIVSGDGGYLITAHDKESFQYNSVLIKTNSDFDILWNKSYNNSIIQDAIEDSESNVLLLYSSSDKERLLKLDNVGDNIWEISLSDVYGSSFNGSICEMTDGYILSGGNHSGNKTTIHKVDKNSNLLWDKEFCGGNVVKILNLGNGECMVIKNDLKDVLEKVYNDVFFPDDNIFGEDDGYYSISFINIFKLNGNGEVVDID